MRALIGLIVIIYLVGIGVVLAPTVRSRSSTDTASDFAANVAQTLPGALAWPAGLYRSVTGRRGGRGSSRAAIDESVAQTATHWVFPAALVRRKRA
jgi:hypothetical protein